MTAPKIFTPEYYERMRALEAQGWWNAGMRDVASIMLKGASLPKRGHFLDVGCGSGQTVSWLKGELRGWTGFGIDLAMDALRAGYSMGLRSLASGSALEIPLRDRSMDLIVTLDVLQHLPLAGGDRRALGEMRRVLKDGGTLFVRTNAQAFPVTPDDLEHNFHRYEPGELATKLREGGFRVDRLSRINAVLGLAEIPRELRAVRVKESSYHGIMATPRPTRGPASRFKRFWLTLEGRAAAAGMKLPMGRTIVAVCTAVSE